MSISTSNVPVLPNPNAGGNPIRVPPGPSRKPIFVSDQLTSQSPISAWVTGVGGNNGGRKIVLEKTTLPTMSSGGAVNVNVPEAGKLT